MSLTQREYTLSSMLNPGRSRGPSPRHSMDNDSFSHVVHATKSRKSRERSPHHQIELGKSRTRNDDLGASRNRSPSHSPLDFCRSKGEDFVPARTYEQSNYRERSGKAAAAFIDLSKYR